MIKKLEIKTVPVPNNPTLVKDVGMDNESLFDKINELVDAVNELQGHIKFLDERIKTKNFMIDIEKNNPVSKHFDPFSEQRQWIGKLCRFWDDNYKITKHFGILTRIDETAIVRYEAENRFWYCACEPVKPDDDIIYKGE